MERADFIFYRPIKTVDRVGGMVGEWCQVLTCDKCHEKGTGKIVKTEK